MKRRVPAFAVLATAASLLAVQQAVAQAGSHPLGDIVSRNASTSGATAHRAGDEVAAAFALAATAVPTP